MSSNCSPTQIYNNPAVHKYDCSYISHPLKVVKCKIWQKKAQILGCETIIVSKMINTLPFRILGLFNLNSAMLCTYRKSWNFWCCRICSMWHVLCIFAWGPKLIPQFRFRTHSISVGEKQAFDQSQQGWQGLTETERSFKTFTLTFTLLHYAECFSKRTDVYFLQYKRSASSFIGDTFQNIYLKQPWIH